MILIQCFADSYQTAEGLYEQDLELRVAILLYLYPKVSYPKQDMSIIKQDMSIILFVGTAMHIDNVVRYTPLNQVFFL